MKEHIHPLIYLLMMFICVCVCAYAVENTVYRIFPYDCKMKTFLLLLLLMLLLLFSISARNFCLQNSKKTGWHCVCVWSKMKMLLLLLLAGFFLFVHFCSVPCMRKLTNKFKFFAYSIVCKSSSTLLAYRILFTYILPSPLEITNIMESLPDLTYHHIRYVFMETPLPRN